MTNTLPWGGVGWGEGGWGWLGVGGWGRGVRDEFSIHKDVLKQKNRNDQVYVLFNIINAALSAVDYIFLFIE
jgi:hypothetical protein